MTESLTITLPGPVVSRPRRGSIPGLDQPSDCPRCHKPIEIADRIRKVYESWLHDECAREAIAAMGPANLWLMLAEHVAATPSAFKASEIRAIVRAVIEIAGATYLDVDLDEAAPVPTPAQWAAWFRCCADEAAPWEMTKEHRFAFRRVAEHFEDGDIVTKAAGITGVDS